MRVFTAAVQALTLCSGALASAASSADVESRCFPDDFMFGSATAAYQVEGAYNESGRTPSIWDAYCRDMPGLECANVADDFFHRYKDDVALMDDMGLQSFRFSISWSRVMTWDPMVQRMRPNLEGLAFYHALIEELSATGIEPILTLYHLDLPLELQTELTPSAWLNSDIDTHFVDFATLMFREFGHKVRYWTTFNEPTQFVGFGYSMGMLPPGHSGSQTEPYVASHNVLRSHGKAVQAFREMKASGEIANAARIGIVLAAAFYYPLNASNPKDVIAATRGLEFDVGWFLSPLITGDYPAVMRERVGEYLPEFTGEDAALLKGSYDLFMLNHYFSRMVTDCDSPSSLMSCASLPAGWPRDKGLDDSHIIPGSRNGHNNAHCEMFTGYPPGYFETIMWLHKHDPTADILLTENGWCGDDQIDNADQLWYFQSFLEQVYKAVVKEKIPVIGYTAWSFLDNYEWGSYGPRFGLNHVNFTAQTGSKDGYSPKPSDLKRTTRLAGKWYSKVATTRCLDNSGELYTLQIGAEVGLGTEFSRTVNWTVVLVAAAVAMVMIIVVTRMRRRGYARLPVEPTA